MSPSYLTDAQLRAELLRCQSCETRPCRRGCPAGCSPADFIMAARCGEPSDYRRAAAHILAHNPLGGACGSVCPDTLCMARCTRRGFDAPVDIPRVQAAIVRKARQLGALPRFEPLPATGERVAVVGAGPAGLGAASVLAKAGHTVHVFDAAGEAGGAWPGSSRASGSIRRCSTPTSPGSSGWATCSSCWASAWSCRATCSREATPR